MTGVTTGLDNQGETEQSGDQRVQPMLVCERYEKPQHSATYRPPIPDPLLGGCCPLFPFRISNRGFQAARDTDPHLAPINAGRCSPFCAVWRREFARQNRPGRILADPLSFHVNSISTLRDVRGFILFCNAL